MIWTPWTESVHADPSRIFQVAQLTSCKTKILAHYLLWLAISIFNLYLKLSKSADPIYYNFPSSVIKPFNSFKNSEI